MKYRMELTEEQFRVMQIALEEYFRLRMCQDFDFVEDMASLNLDLSPENPHHDRIFDKFIERRDNLREVMRCFFRICFPSGFGLQEKTEDMMIAECLWDTIRFHRGQSRWDQPFRIGSEPVPNVEKLEECRKEGKDESKQSQDRREEH